MAYATSNPPAMLVCPIGGPAPRLWFYRSADAAATVQAANYITNGGALGMKVGDIVFGEDTNLGITNSYRVVTVSATYPGAVDLSNGTVIGSGTNS